MTDVEITQLKVEKVLLNLGSADSTVRAGDSYGTPLASLEFRLLIRLITRLVFGI